MANKSAHLQIRVTPRQKAALKKAAAAAGQDLSHYVLARALPSNRSRFESLLGRLLDGSDHRYILAELNDFLSSQSAAELREAVTGAPAESLSSFLRNYVAAMVEQASYSKGVSAPEWTRDVAPLDVPYFAAPLESLRLHLLRASPIPFKRRNLFVDAALGDRV
jgi:uncharacterized protein (DUF1778 family)